MHQAYESILECIEWTRKNTIELFNLATEHQILNYIPSYKTPGEETKNVLYQFQCILTTTDKRLRTLLKDDNQQFGILMTPQKTFSKREIPTYLINGTLSYQIGKIRKIVELIEDSDDEVLFQLHSLLAHEHLHQGQLVVMFREAGVSFPNEFLEAWDLNGRN